MPTAADFENAAAQLRTALDHVERARGDVDGIGEHGIHGGSLQVLVDAALVEQRSNLDGLSHALSHALEVAEYRQAVCEQYAEAYAAWQTELSDWYRERADPGFGSVYPPAAPSKIAPWVER